MNWEDTVTQAHWPLTYEEYLKDKQRQAEISFKAGVRYVLSRAVGEGCLCNDLYGKHGIHINDKLYEELSNDGKPNSRNGILSK